MHKRPLAVISVFFIIGIVLAKYLPDSIKFLHIFVAALILITLILTLSLKRERGYEMGFHKRERGSNIFLLLSITSFAALLYINSNTFPNNHINRFLGEGKIKTDIVGIIKSPALTRRPYYGKICSTYLFEIEQIGNRNVNGLTHIRIQTEREYRYGDRLMVKGTIRNPKFKIQNPKFQKTNFNYGEYLENQNIFAIINASEENVTLLSHNYKSNPVLRYAYSIREKIKNQFLEKMPLDTGAFMRAIILRDRSELPKELQESFRNSGTMHILPVQCRARHIYPS